MRRLLLFLFVAGVVAVLLRPLGGSSSLGWPLRPPVLVERLGAGNLLVLGLDRRGAELARTDTLLLARVGPPGRAASFLSIPRDLWVPIPGHGQDRINTAYSWGELGGGDGASLARRTVEESFGVRVERVAVVDFACFQHAVDAAGGVTVDVPQRLVDEAYPTDDGGTAVVVFETGQQKIAGPRALQYVRTRAADSDFGRIRRQQQVVGALAARLRDPAAAVHVSGVLLGRCAAAGTDLSPADLAALAAVGGSGGEPTFHLLGESMVSPTVLPSGAQVLMPRWERIRPLVAEIFGAGR